MIQWRKSSHSGTSGQSDCVELANLGSEVGVRDSKNPQEGHFTLAPATFTSLIAEIKAGKLDL